MNERHCCTARWLAVGATAAALVASACGGARALTTFQLLSSPEVAGQILVAEESKLVEVCSTFESSATAPTSSKVTDLLRREQRENLGALLDALRTSQARAKNSCRSDDLEQCTKDLRAAFDAAQRGGGDLARVGKGVEAALGDLSSLSPDQASALGTRIRFSVLAVDGYIRLANGLEREVDQFVDGLDIPIPLASSLARGLAREASAEIVASGTSSMVHVLEEHSLVHRPAMIRQACERYLTNTDMGTVASHGVRRIILSASENPTEFTERRCKALAVVAKDDGQAELKRYGGCAVIVKAAQAGKASVRKVVTAPGGDLKNSADLGKDAMPTGLSDKNLKRDEARAASVIQVAALACADLLASAAGNGVRCSEGTFNALGSAAALDPPKTTVAGGIPGPSEVKKLALRVEELVSAQGRTTVAVEQLRKDVEGFVDLTGARFDGVDRALADLSHAQRDVAVAVGRCDKERKKIRDGRRRVFDGSGDGPKFDEVCGENYGKRFVSRSFSSNGSTSGNLAFYVADLCNEQSAVPVAIRIDGGLFQSGKSVLSQEAEQKLKAAWAVLKTGAGLDARNLSGSVVGHVDPQGFSKGEYGPNQLKLMEERAAAAKTAIGGDAAALTVATGDVPPMGTCATSARACSEWRTVSLETRSLFPVLDNANCK